MLLNAHYQKFNPFRTPDWRWERVLHLCDRHPTPGRCTKWDDDFIKQAREHLLLWRRFTPAQREQLFWKNPGLTYAIDIYEKLNIGERTSTALTIEARLLANQSYDQIADEAGTLPAAIDWYEALFFNVRDHLKKRDWIFSNVLAPAMMRAKVEAGDSDGFESFSTFKNSEVAKPFFDGSLKFFAYFGGPYLVDHLITGFRAGQPLESLDNIDQWYDRTMGSLVRRRSTQAAGQFEINKFNVTELFQVHHAIMALERSQDNIDAQKSTTERHIQALLEDIPWSLGADGEMLLEGTVLGEYDKGAAELRDEEVLRMSSGQDFTPEDVPQQIPPPRKKNPSLEKMGFKPPEK